jgi:hypothetical protein
MAARKEKIDTMCPLPMVVPQADWPEQDRALWEANIHAGDDLDDPVYAVNRRPQTIINAGKSWGRFLAVLRDAGVLDPRARPADRVTPANVNAFVRAMGKAGNKGSTIAVRLFDLRAALKVMEPMRDADFAWIVRPHGQCAWNAFPSEPKVFPVFHPHRLMRFGISMMEVASADLTKLTNLIAYRNGLLFAVEAASGMRLGSVVALQLGDNIRRVDTAWHLDLKPDDMKTGQSLEFDLWRELTPWLDLYVGHVRPAFGAAGLSGPFWVIEGGGQLGYRSVETMIRRVSPQVDGTAFGSHTFRRSVGTAGPLANPSQPAATAAMLGVSKAVLERHYNLGNTAEAARQFQKAVREERGG